MVSKIQQSMTYDFKNILSRCIWHTVKHKIYNLLTFDPVHIQEIIKLLLFILLVHPKFITLLGIISLIFLDLGKAYYVLVPMHWFFKLCYFVMCYIEFAINCRVTFFIHNVIVIHFSLPEKFQTMNFIFLFSVHSISDGDYTGDFSQRTFNRKWDHAECDRVTIRIASECLRLDVKMHLCVRNKGGWP